MSQVGRRVPRKEDDRLLTGRGRFGSDVRRSDALCVRVVRSSVAHGRIAGIDTAAARALPGVVDVVTAADLPAHTTIPVRVSVRGLSLDEHRQPVLAGDVVRYVGEPVAVVVAADAYVAEDAAELVSVDLDELDVRLDVDAPDASVVADFEIGYGDADAVFEAACHVVAMDFAVGRHSGVPLEPRTLTVDYVSGALEIFGVTKVPVFNRSVLADLLGIDESAIRMHAVDAGGGFGVRGEFYPEDFLVPWLAIRHRRSITWVEDRAEHLVAVNHSREQRHRIEAAFDCGGGLLALRDDVRHDNGAYIRTHGVIVPELTLAMLPGPYRVPAYDGRVRVMLTNKTPCGTYRGPGRFEGTAAREQLFDLAARELGIDRVELRRRNLLTRSELPLTRGMSALGTDVVLDGGDYAGLYERALERVNEFGWPELVADGRAAGRLRGLGIATFLEKSGLGPQETADVQITGTGRVRVHSGGTSLGQGIETVLAQIAADELDLPIERVDVINGDTLLQPYGGGSWASRSTVVSGSAVRGAGREVAERLCELGSRMLEVARSDVELAGGQVRVRGAPTNARAFADVWKAAQPGSPWLGLDEPAGISARYRFTVDHMTYPYGTHICIADVDPATGGVRIVRYLVAYEVGRAVNPTLVEGQLRGGVAQGIGGALLEEFSYDDAGQPQATTFMDYLLPTASEIPVVDVLVSEEAPAESNPLGVRGAGEGGLTGAGAAIASAVSDALGVPAMTRLPLTPGRLIDAARSAANAQRSDGGRIS